MSVVSLGSLCLCSWREDAAAFSGYLAACMGLCGRRARLTLQPGGVRSRPICWSLVPWLAAGGETTQAAQLNQQKTSWAKCVLLLERPRSSLEVGGAHGLHKAAPRVPLPLAAGRELLQRLEIWVGAPTGC